MRPDQRDFVTSNLICTAEKQFYPDWSAFAIYHEQTMVGFVMYEHEPEEDSWWISTLMIAAEHQGKGYGKAAIQALLAVMQQQGCQTTLVGYADDNVIARTLYGSVGFQEIGLDEDGDMVAKLDVLHSVTP